MALTAKQKVSLRIGDTDQLIFDDDQLQDFLGENDSDINLASSDACLAIAANMSLISKLEITGDHTIDRRKQPDHWVALAKQFRAQSENQPAFGIAQVANTHFNEEEIIERAYITSL
tara:strand:+ start:326 stop:676 length:351 start_codon:yes stop_codon:yes gene_type:complete